MTTNTNEPIDPSSSYKDHLISAGYSINVGDLTEEQLISGTKYIIDTVQLKNNTDNGYVYSSYTNTGYKPESFNEKYNKFVASRLKNPHDIVADITPAGANLLHLAMGIAGESGEIVDAIKKHVIYGKPLDVNNVIEELGDILFYITALCEQVDTDIDMVRELNISKLEKRYSSGSYSNTEAQQRADKT